MAKRPAQHEAGALSKRRKGPGSEVLTKTNGRLKVLLEGLIQCGALATSGTEPSLSTALLDEGTAKTAKESALKGHCLPECSHCAFHRSHGSSGTVSANDIRQRVSSWAWADVKKLLHRRCVHSMTVQHSNDSERVLLRGFLHVPHDDVEICSCNGTPTASRVARAAAASAGKNAASSSANATAAARVDGPASGAAVSSSFNNSAGSVTSGNLTPGTCGPIQRFGHVVEVMLSTEDWSIMSCSSSCCGVGYDALQSQFCPAVAAVLLAARMGGGASVLCEHDMRKVLNQPVQADAPTGPQDARAETGAGATAAASEAADVGAGLLGADRALGLGPPTVARLFAAASEGALVLGPNHVDPPPPVSASLLPGPGVPLGLQRELESPRRVPEALRPHLIPSSSPAAVGATGGAGPSTSAAPAPLVSVAPPVPPPHVPALPTAEVGIEGNARYQSGYAVGSHPSAAARAVFAGWYREGAPIVVTTDRYRESFRMLLAPEGPAAAGGSADLRAGSPTRRPTAASAPSLPPAWAFGSGGGSVSLELTGETAQRYISSRAAERGPVWEARMNLLSSSTALELDPELRLHTGASDSSDPWPPVVLYAFDEASCPVGSPAGSNGPAGALCGLLRVTWLCLHVWDLDGGLARRAKLVVQAICKILLAADLPAYLRAATARLLGSWRLRVGDAAAIGRKPGYGSSNDVTLAELLARLNTAYTLARDGWDAPHVCSAMSVAPAAPAGPAAMDAAVGGAGAQAAHVPSRGGTSLAPASCRTTRTGGQGDGTPAAGAAPARPDLQPTWTGFRPINQAAVRRQQQQQQQQGNGAGGAGAGAGAQLAVVETGTAAPAAAPQPAMPFVPYAPPPLQGIVHTSISGLQEVTERLQWLGHFGLDGPYVALAAASGEWSKAIKMLLRRGAKSDVERACRLAVERLSSAAAKAQQACFLLHQVLGPAQTKKQETGPAGEGAGADGGGAGAAGQPAVESGAAGGSGGGGVESLVVSAVAQLPPTFVAGCAGRMFMSAVRTALNIKLGASDGGPYPNPSNAAFEMSFLRALPNPAQEGVSPAAALLAAISPNTAGGAGATRPSPYTALLRSVIAMVAEQQEREWRAEEESLREAGLLEGPQEGSADGEDKAEGQQDASAASKGGGAATAGEPGAGDGATAGGSASAGGGGGAAGGGRGAEAGAPQGAANYADYVMATLAAIAGRHNAGAAAMQRRDVMADQCDCEACRRERRERLAHMESELPPGTVQFARLRPEDACFVSDPAALAAFSRVVPLVPPRRDGGSPSGNRVHSLAVQVVRSVFCPVLASLADPQDKPRNATEYGALLAMVEESMGTLCDDFMPERVQLQAVLEGVTCALCALYCCHNAAGAAPAALGRVVTELLAAGQLALARQVAACQLSMTRSPDSLAHTLEVAVACGDEAQREMALELLRMAATEPPPEQRLAAARAAARFIPLNGPLPPGMAPDDLYPIPPYMDYSDDYDSDDTFMSDEIEYDPNPYRPLSDEDDDMEYDDPEEYGLQGLYHMFDHELMERRRLRQERREDRLLARAERRAARAAMDELERRGNAGAGAIDLTRERESSESDHSGHHGEAADDTYSNDTTGGRRRRGHAAAAPGGGDSDNSGSESESDLNTEDVLAGRRRGSDPGDDSEDEGDRGAVTGPEAMELDYDEAERQRIRAEKGKAIAPQPGAQPPSKRRAIDAAAGGGSGSGAGPSNGAGHGGNSSRSHRRRQGGGGHEEPPSNKGRSTPAKPDERKTGGTDATEPEAPYHGPHELAMNLATLASPVLYRRLVRAEADQNLFALAQYIRGRGASAELVAPLMAGSMACLESFIPHACLSSMNDFANDMLALRNTPPLRHASRLEGRTPDSPCLKGLPASSWQSFVTARNYRYATSRDDAGVVREVVVSMDYRDPLVLTAWVCAAYSSDLAGRRRVLAAMALAVSCKYGPTLAHLGVALARCGLSQAAVFVANRALAPAAVRYSTFTSNANALVPAVGQIWYPVCMLELAPVFVEVLEQAAAHHSAPAVAASASPPPQEQSLNGGGGGTAQGTGAAAAGSNMPKDQAEEAVAAAEAEAEGRGVGEWRVPRLDLASARAAVANLAVTLLLLRCELPRCLLACAEAVTAVMALLSKVATGCGVKHEQLFEGGGAGSLTAAGHSLLPGGMVHTLSEWVVVAMRECLLGPLRSAPREVQQAFVTAVAAMPDNELDFKMKIPLLEWARGARVPVATIFDAASRAVASATRNLDVEAAAERAALHSALRELSSMAAAFAVLRGAGALGLPAGPQQHQHTEHALVRATNVGILSDVQLTSVRHEMELALAVSNGQGGFDVWIQDKRTPVSAASLALRARSNSAVSTIATSGHRSWMWHVLKWVGERLVEEMAAAPPENDGARQQQPATSATGSGRGGRHRRNTVGSAEASRDTSPCPPMGAASGGGGGGSPTDPRIMLQQLVDRTGTFRGPELLPLGCTLLDVVIKEGPGSEFVVSARSLLTRAILPEAGRSAALAANDAWRSPEYRAGLRRILDRWKAERETLQQPQQHAGRSRCGASGPLGGSSIALTDDLAEKVALTLVIAEGTIASLRLASSVMDLTRPAGAAAAEQAANLPSPRTLTRGGASGTVSAAAKSEQPPTRLELRLPVKREGTAGTSSDQHAHAFGKVTGQASAMMAGPSRGLASGLLPPGAVAPASKSVPAPAHGHTAASRRGRGSAAAAAATVASAAAATSAYRYPEPPDISVVDEGWEDRGQKLAATMPSSAGWALEPLSLHGALRPLLVLGAMELPRDDPREAATLRFLQVQAVPPVDAVATALAPLGVSTEGAAGSSSAYSCCVSRNYSPRYSAAVWRLVLQLMRRDAALLSCCRAASPAMDNVHRALQVGIRALAPGTSAARTLSWQRRMEAPTVAAAASLTPGHVRCAVAILRVWVGSRWLLGSCRPPPPQPQTLAEVMVGAVVGGGGQEGGGVDVPLEEKEPAVTMLVDDLQRLSTLNTDLAMDCVRDNAAKYGQQQQPQGAGAQAAASMPSARYTLGAQQPVAQLAPGQVGGPAALSGGSALLSEEEVERLNRLDGFVAALGEHMKADPSAKKVLFVLQPRLPLLHDKVLRFLHKNRNNLTREALVAKLVRDFNMVELEQLRVAHLPWTPIAVGTKAMRAAELAEWICEHQNEYLEQQGRGAGMPRRRYEIHFW